MKDFIECKNCQSLIKSAKECQKVIFGLIVEKIEDFKGLKGVYYCYDVYKDRLYPNGYDDYLRIGKTFQEFLEQI